MHRRTVMKILLFAIPLDVDVIASQLLRFVVERLSDIAEEVGNELESLSTIRIVEAWILDTLGVVRADERANQSTTFIPHQAFTYMAAITQPPFPQSRSISTPQECGGLS